MIVEKLLPGRGAEVRPSTPKEQAATLVLALPVDQWSLKVSDVWPDDDPADLEGHTWAGVVPLHLTPGEHLPAPDLRAGVPVPPSVRRLTGG